MLISLAWAGWYLARSLNQSQSEQILIHAGFPIESTTPLPGGDVRFDVEVTSNRGDCLSHLGIAREIAATNGIEFTPPSGSAFAGRDAERDPAMASDFITVENRVPLACPRFTARIIRDVKIGPSPAWLKDALEAVGQRSINNVVDVTNFINFELGQPCHAFDLARLAKGPDGKAALVIRQATPKEQLTTLDGKVRTLVGHEIVVADASRPQGLAGMIGGGDSEVSPTTTDVVLEVATWDPVAVRKAARHHAIRTDASYRYERLVDVRGVDANAERAAHLLAAVCGGRLCTGAVVAGPLVPELYSVPLRPERCRQILGISIPREEISAILSRLGIGIGPLGRGGEDLLCVIPAHRPDLTREIDLIEEIARLKGLEALAIEPSMRVSIAPPQRTELARREACALLTGLGFFEAVTFSFTTPKEAAAFMPKGLIPVKVDDDRRGDTGVARPSVLTGLLTCRRANQNAQVEAEGGIRLFEVAAVFAQMPVPGASVPRSIENQNLGLLLDVPARGRTAGVAEIQAGVRCLRGVIESLVRTLHGSHAALAFTPMPPPCEAFDAAACAGITLDDQPLGILGVIDRTTQALYDLALPVVAAELNWPLLLAKFPPRATLSPLPAFPGIERDVSLILDEPVTWAKVEGCIRENSKNAQRLEAWSFVTTFRGGQIGKGKKSMTVRLAFRDAERTLKHEEVDGPVASIVESLKRGVGAEVRQG